MKNHFTFAVVLLFLISFISANLSAQDKQEIKKSFDKRSRVKIDLVTSNCKITKSTDNKINVKVVFDYDEDDYEATIEDGGSRIHIEEEFYANNPSGKAEWTIELPDDVELDFESATGDLNMKGIKLELQGNSGTGNMDLENCSGEFDLNSGTGDIALIGSEGKMKLNSGTGDVILTKCKGSTEANSGTGDVAITNINLFDDSDFNSGTGDVEVSLASSPDCDLTVNSGTGNARLNYNGNEVKGEFELTCKEYDGSIRADVQFDSEKVQRRHGDFYEVKTFKRGTGMNRIHIGTGTGRAEFKTK